MRTPRPHTQIHPPPPRPRRPHQAAGRTLGPCSRRHARRLRAGRPRVRRQAAPRAPPVGVARDLKGGREQPRGAMGCHVVSRGVPGCTGVYRGVTGSKRGRLRAAAASAPALPRRREAAEARKPRAGGGPNKGGRPLTFPLPPTERAARDQPGTVPAPATYRAYSRRQEPRMAPSLARHGKCIGKCSAYDSGVLRAVARGRGRRVGLGGCLQAPVPARTPTALLLHPSLSVRRRAVPAREGGRDCV